jgi:hypothetical protein
MLWREGRGPIVLFKTKLSKSFKKSHSFPFAEAIPFLVAIQFSGNCKLAKGTANMRKREFSIRFKGTGSLDGYRFCWHGSEEF